ncbi:hypothetical protein Anas_11130 [Armadillidium nasatum]|uniref:Uncharacterized protein n=1 Tax=Armadillidium nasatum TaxID=96803 RepID=A0A5N5TA91_9CRUS|nr:hypothetical protein Anas_11130 [Armadillidium nasatum]
MSAFDYIENDYAVLEIIFFISNVDISIFIPNEYKIYVRPGRIGDLIHPGRCPLRNGGFSMFMQLRRCVNDAGLGSVI